MDIGQRKGYFDFLGYRFWRGKTSGRIRRVIRPKSEKKFKESLKPLTRRTNGQSLPALVQGLQAKLQGSFGYFKHVGVESLRKMGGWIRGRLRSILRKTAGLRGCGRGRDHQRWKNRYFADLGLMSLKAVWASESVGLRKVATY